MMRIAIGALIPQAAAASEECLLRPTIFPISRGRDWIAGRLALFIPPENLDPMASKLLQLLLVPTLLLSAACSDAGEQIGVPEDPGRFQTPQESEHAPTDTVTHATDHDGHDALPLRPIMIQLAADLAGFTQAMWVEDYETMSERSHAVADHTHISDEEMQRIQSILGAQMAEFEEADERVHILAERLHEAAEDRDLDAVLGTLAEIQTACMACHTRFREPLRTQM